MTVFFDKSLQLLPLIFYRLMVQIILSCVVSKFADQVNTSPLSSFDLSPAFLVLSFESYDLLTTVGPTALSLQACDFKYMDEFPHFSKGVV